MEKILIVSSYSKNKELLVSLASESGHYKVDALDNGLQCREVIKNNCYDLIIINSPLKDESGQKLSIDINTNTNSSVILIIKNNSEEELYKVENQGIVIVEKPLNKILIMKIINSNLIQRRKFNLIIDENKKLRKKIEEIKLIERAKITLIQYLKMSEEESHKYIEKQAMNLRITRVEVAKNILKIYEY